jgi:hypothetical protein
MAVTDQILVGGNSMFGIGLQAGKGVPRSTNSLFRWFSYTGLPYGINQSVQNLPPEGGKSITPRAAYKASAYGAGQISLIPRLISDFATILLAAMGNDTVTTGFRFGKANDVSPYVDLAQTGSNIHTISLASNEADIPYITTRRMLEGANRLGETVQDNRIGGLELTVPSSGPMSANVELMGRTPSDVDVFDLDPWTNWGLSSASYEADNAFGLAVDGNSVVRLDGADLYCTGVVTTVQNSLLPPNQGQVIGALTPLDYPVLGRVATIRATVLVTNYNLYRDIYAGAHAASNTKLSSAVKMGNLDFRIYSPATFDANGTPVNYALNVRSTNSNISWALPAPLAVNPQQPVLMTLVGTVQRPSSGNYLEFRFQNGNANAYKAAKATSTGNIGFSATSGNHITGTGFTAAGFANGDKVIVRGSAANDGVYTVTTATDTDLSVTETVTTATAASGITVTA